MRGLRFLVLLSCVLAMPSFVMAKHLALVADIGNSTTNLSSADLAKIFAAHMRNWPDGKTITIVMQDPSSADMQVVVRKLFNMNSDQARAFIHAHPGMVVLADSDEAVIRFVTTTRGAIGVVDLYSLTKDVNVLKVDGKLPVEPGYLLRGN